ncbi:MAG: PilZ domain-containing protein [Hungatella sp.]|nr:PilZ domain-containing protein [Hungatella sp.]
MRLRDCEGCLVYGTDNKPLSRARVETGSDDSIRLYFSNYKLRSVRFKAFVDFYDMQQGLIRCFCEVVIRKNVQENRLNEPWMADCKVIEISDVYQRQKDLRVRVHIPMEFSTENGEFFVGTIKNISAGGIFLVTSQAIKTGTKFAFTYRFEKDPCRVSAKILRAKGAMSGGIGYGCQFLNLPPETEANIRRFVFAKQMEKQKKPGRDTL